MRVQYGSYQYMNMLTSLKAGREDIVPPLCKDMGKIVQDGKDRPVGAKK